MERDLARDREPVRTFLLLRAISVRRNTLDMYAELSPRIRKAVRRNFAGVTWGRQVEKLIALPLSMVCMYNVCLYNAVHVSNGDRSLCALYLPVSVCRTWLEQSLCHSSKSHSSTRNFVAKSVCKIIKLKPSRPDRRPESNCYLFTTQLRDHRLKQFGSAFSLLSFLYIVFIQVVVVIRSNRAFLIKFESLTRYDERVISLCARHYQTSAKRLDILFHLFLN